MDEIEFKAALDRVNGTIDAIEAMNALPPPMVREPSKASFVGGTRAPESPQAKGGEFLQAIYYARSPDAQEQAFGKATLERLGIGYLDEAAIRVWSKATLGTTDTTGGWITPNAVVDDIEKPAAYANLYRALITLRPGVRSFQVDLPVRTTGPSRAVIQPVGDTKENVNLAYGGYSATMYTLARIYDLARQFLRTSGGAAQADVLEELGTAIGLGESYYIINGNGSGEPYGLLRALDTAALGAFDVAFTPSGTTLAGSVLKAISKCVGALADRNRTAGLAAVVSGSTWAEMASQGTDTAGFFLSGVSGPQSIPGVPPGTLVTPFGVPVFPDSQFGDDRLVVGQWKSLKLYIGEGYRVDVSDVAGDRWDKNLVGFRGEEEIGFDARPAVYAGAFAQVTNVLA